MNAGDELGSAAVTFVVFQQKLAGFFVQSRFGIGIDEKAFDGNENVPDAICRLPVFLQSVHANFASWPNIGVKDLCGEPTW